MTRCALVILTLLLFGATNSRAQVADAGPDTTLCVNFYTMQGSPLPPGAIGTWSMVSGCNNVSITNAGSPTTNVNFFCSGVCVFMWTVNDNGTISSDQVVITVYDPNMPFANAGMDQTIVGPQNSAQLMGSPAPIWPATCYWNILTGPSIITDPSDPYAVAAGLGVGDNIFVWTCENGPCWSSPTVDTLVIQMMMITGLDEFVPSQPAFTWDPVQHRLQFLGSGRINGLLLFDAHGKAIPLGRNAGQGSWQISMLKPGVYLIRAEVDGRLVQHRFVVMD